MSEWCVTETPDDPSLNPLWVGDARDAMHALDQFAVEAGFVPYSELERDEPGQWTGDTVTYPEPMPLPQGALWAVFTNTTVYAIPLEGGA